MPSVHACTPEPRSSCRSVAPPPGVHTLTPHAAPTHSSPRPRRVEQHASDSLSAPGAVRQALGAALREELSEFYRLLALLHAQAAAPLPLPGGWVVGSSQQPTGGLARTCACTPLAPHAPNCQRPQGWGRVYGLLNPHAQSLLAGWPKCCCFGTLIPIPPPHPPHTHALTRAHTRARTYAHVRCTNTPSRNAQRHHQARKAHFRAFGPPPPHPPPRRRLPGSWGSAVPDTHPPGLLAGRAAAAAAAACAGGRLLRGPRGGVLGGRGGGGGAPRRPLHRRVRGEAAAAGRHEVTLLLIAVVVERSRPYSPWANRASPARSVVARQSRSPWAAFSTRYPPARSRDAA